MSKKCLGCGISLQTTDSSKLGFTKSLDMDYCMRCFRLKNYHENSKLSFIVDNSKILEKVNSGQGKVFFFIDILNIYQENIQLFLKVKLPKILVISKIDVLPKNISLKVVENYLRNHFHIQEEILFVQRKRNSAKKIYEHIEKDASSNFYFLGLTNAGKSSLLNLLLEELVENSKPITVSEIPNTTLDFIQISLPNRKKIQDSVGFTYDYCFKDFEMLQKILVKKEIRPKNFYLKKETILSLENQIFLKLDDVNSITWFGSENLLIKKIYKEKNEEYLSFSVPAKTNIYLKGVGFFYVKNAAVVQIAGLKEENIAIEPSFLGGNFYG